MISLQNVSKAYGTTTVLRELSFRVEPKEFLCITGRSGAGKSTLLALLIGAEAATSGKIEVDGVDLRTVPPPVMQLYRRRLGVVFQEYRLLQNRTVAENVAFPLEVAGASDAVIENRVAAVLTQVGLADKASAYPSELSGGEKARAAIARAIVHDPLIILADEPTGNLDPDQSFLIVQLFQEIHKSGTTVLLATHDAGLVDLLQTRVIRLEEGRIVRDSVGGYDKAKRQTTASDAEPAEHHVFEEDHPSSATPAKSPKGKRKVKITSIGSQLE